MCFSTADVEAKNVDLNLVQTCLQDERSERGLPELGHGIEVAPTLGGPAPVLVGSLQLVLIAPTRIGGGAGPSALGMARPM
jgi:hypothetical protein